jgi:hypothetical protein
MENAELFKGFLTAPCVGGFFCENVRAVDGGGRKCDRGDVE